MKRGLIVSCQALPGEPLHGDGTMAKMAKAAEMAGAVGLRLNGTEDVKSVRNVSSLPMIGIIKRNYDGYTAYITPTMKEVRELAEVKPDIIAVDATGLTRKDFESAPGFIRAIKKEFPNQKIMADISTLEEAVAAAEAGADFVGTTMAGYTPWTTPTAGPDFALLKKIIDAVDGMALVIAEGRVESGTDALRCLEMGAHAVVVGGAITRPQQIAKKFVDAISLFLARNENGTSKSVCLDIGGTFVKWGVLGLAGGIISHGKERTNLGSNELLTQICSIIERIMPDECAGIGISTAGQVNPLDGSILFATNNLPGWTGTPLKRIISERFGMPCFADNDVNCAALGEFGYGSCRGVRNFICVAYGTGIGGALFCNGGIVRGRGGAGEFGHMIIRQGGRPCNCGNRGCYEQYASAAALRKDAVMALGTSFPDDAGVEWLFDRYDDERVKNIIHEYVSSVAAGIVGLVHAFDPEVVLLGGAISENAHIMSLVRDAVLVRVMPSYSETLSVVPASLGNKAALFGAMRGLCDEIGSCKG